MKSPLVALAKASVKLQWVNTTSLIREETSAICASLGSDKPLAPPKGILKLPFLSSRYIP